jgi:RES domain-containing protein
MPALYLSLSIETAVKEANQSFAFKIDPCVLCSYDVDCADIADLQTDAGRAAHDVMLRDMACSWFSYISDGEKPPSWRIAERMISDGYAGILVPSFAPRQTVANQNLVLWRWSDHPPHQVRVFDPSGRLPRNQLSWD